MLQMHWHKAAAKQHLIGHDCDLISFPGLNFPPSRYIDFGNRALSIIVYHRAEDFMALGSKIYVEP